MDPKNEILHLVNQHPNPWNQGQWYPATTLAGRKCEIKKTRSVKNNAPYLHIRYRGTLNTKTPQGEIIDSHPCWMNFRANLTTFELLEI